MPARDPRINPFKGDVVISRHKIRREVLFVEYEPCMVQCLEGRGFPPYERRPNLKQWKRWAVGGSVERATITL